MNTPPYTIEKLSNLLSREMRYQKKRLSELRNKPIEESLAMGEVLGPLRIKEVKKGLGLVFIYKGFFSRFRKGDRIDINTYSNRDRFSKIRESETTIVEIKYPEYGQIEVITSIKQQLDKFSKDTDYYFFPSNASIINQRIKGKLNLINELTHSYSPKLSLAIPNSFKSEDSFDKLNDSQKYAVEILASKGLEGRIQGPPGTGKTRLLEAIVDLALNYNFTIGITAFTHAAVDNAFSRVVSKHIDKSVRIGKSETIKKHLYKKDDLKRMTIVERCSILEKKYAIYASTMHSLVMSNSPPKVDLLIVDEAGQVPIYFAPFLKKIGERVIMLGDHKQLPPVFSEEIKDVKKDIFSIDEKDHMLNTQYRMNSDIQSWSSSRFYNNELKPDESVAERDILSEKTGVSSSRVNLQLHENKSARDYSNEKEAEEVAKKIKKLESAGVPLKQIGVITPYRMQAGAINSKIQEEYNGDTKVMDKINVDTVERFQGQQREVIILSFGADQEKIKSENQVFLGDGRRLNVSVTRARSRFYCFGSKKLKNQYQIKQEGSYLKDFLNWCSDMSVGSAS